MREVREAQSRPTPEQARDIRCRAGLTRARLAEVLGVHPQTVVRWELRLRTPRGEIGRAYYALIEDLRRVVAA